MGEISMSGSMRERGVPVIGRKAFHPVLSSLLYRRRRTLQEWCLQRRPQIEVFGLGNCAPAGVHADQ